MKGIRRAFSNLRQRPSVSGSERRFNEYDMTILCFGCMMGSGYYSLLSEGVQLAGPAAFIAFLIAGATAYLAATCYGELAGRMPGVASPYSFHHQIMGKPAAFTVGWSLILQNSAGIGCLCKALSSYLQWVLFRNQLTIDILLDETNGLSPVLDIMGLIVALLCSGVGLISLRRLMVPLRCLFGVNLFSLMVMICSSLSHAETDNWSLPKERIPPNNAGEPAISGGFLPYGYHTLLSGAVSFFYSYTGFELASLTGKEAARPEEVIPRTMILALLVNVFCCVVTGLAYSLMWPFYDQPENPCPFSTVFQKMHLPREASVMYIGEFCTISTCLFYSILGQVRVVKSMSSDKMLFPFFLVQAPTVTILICSVLVGILVFIWSSKTLEKLCVLCCLLISTSTCVCLLLKKYECESDAAPLTEKIGMIQILFNHPDRWLMPTRHTMRGSRILIALTTLLVTMAVLSLKLSEAVGGPSYIGAGLCVVFLLLAVFSMRILNRQPFIELEGRYKVSLVPFLPFLAITVFILFMTNVGYEQWVIVCIWTVIGQVLYWVRLREDEEEGGVSPAGSPRSPVAGGDVSGEEGTAISLVEDPPGRSTEEHLTRGLDQEDSVEGGPRVIRSSSRKMSLSVLEPGFEDLSKIVSSPTLQWGSAKRKRSDRRRGRSAGGSESPVSSKESSSMKFWIFEGGSDSEEEKTTGPSLPRGSGAKRKPPKHKRLKGNPKISDENRHLDTISADTDTKSPSNRKTQEPGRLKKFLQALKVRKRLLKADTNEGSSKLTSEGSKRPSSSSSD